MATEGPVGLAPVAYQAACRDCGFSSRAMNRPGALAAGRCHAISQPDHDVYVDRHPEVEYL